MKSTGLEVENTHTYKHTALWCGGAIPIKDKKEKRFFSQATNREKQNRVSKQRSD